MVQLSVNRTFAWHLPCHQRHCGFSVSLQHGARWVSRGRQRPQQQISFGRRRAQDYEQDYEQEYEQGIAPAPEPIVEQRSVPLSVTGLVSRGLVQEEKGTNKGDPYYKDIMKHVNTVDMEQLSDDQIAAARARRMKERDTARFDIEKMDLPENHPFAVAKQVSKDEEELAKKRLSVKRGLPLQDLTGKRGFPDDPRLAANQKLQDENEMLDEQAARARQARLARQAAAQQQQQ